MTIGGLRDELWFFLYDKEKYKITINQNIYFNKIHKLISSTKTYDNMDGMGFFLENNLHQILLLFDIIKWNDEHYGNTCTCKNDKQNVYSVSTMQ